MWELFNVIQLLIRVTLHVGGMYQGYSQGQMQEGRNGI